MVSLTTRRPGWYIKVRSNSPQLLSAAVGAAAPKEKIPVYTNDFVDKVGFRQ